MKKSKQDNGVAFVKKLQKDLSGLERQDDLELFRQWRDSILNSVITAIKTNDKKTMDGALSAYDFLGDDLSIFFECGFFHQAYLDNLYLSIDIACLNMNNETVMRERLDAIDRHALPSSKKTRAFKGPFLKALSGVFAYVLSDSNKDCSIHLACFISKQIFKIGTESEVYAAYAKIKRFASKGNCISLPAMTALFMSLYFKSADYNSLKSRANHGRSKLELEKAMESFKKIREKIVIENIKSAQKTLRESKGKYNEKFKPDFIESITGFNGMNFKIDDEMACVVLCLSAFQNPIMEATILAFI